MNLYNGGYGYSPVNDYPTTGQWTNVQKDITNAGLTQDYRNMINDAMILQSPGGWSGYGIYAEPVARQHVSFADGYLIPNSINTFNQVTNTQYYSPNAFNEFFNYWDSRTQHLGSSGTTYGNLGYTLDSAVPGMSQFMDQSTGPLANYSATSTGMYSLFDSLGMGGLV